MVQKEGRDHFFVALASLWPHGPDGHHSCAELWVMWSLELQVKLYPSGRKTQEKKWKPEGLGKMLGKEI